MSSEFSRIREVFDEIAPPIDPRTIVETVQPRRWRGWQVGIAAAAGAALIIGGGYLVFSGSVVSEVADTTTTSTSAPITTATTAVDAVPIVRLTPSSIACSAELAAFPCSNLVDGDPTTEWQAPNGGVGTVITLQFAEPVTIEEVRLTNIPDDTRFMRNGRIREVVATASPSLAVIRPGFPDSNDRPAGFGHRDWIGVTSLEIEVTGGYPGQSVDDLPSFAELALAELEVYGRVGALRETDPVTVTTMTAELPGPLAGTWLRTNPDLGGLMVQVRDLIWDGEAFYLLIRVGFGDLIVWRSPDGIEWSEYSQIGTSGTTDGPWQLVSVDGRLIAGGRRGLVATVWIEEGGSPWREVVVASTGGIIDLVYREGLFVALGNAPAWDEMGELPPPRHGVVWTSPDAETWSEAAGSEIFGEESFPSSLADGPAGLLCITIQGDFPRHAPTIRVVSSVDGAAWVARQPVGLDLTQVDVITGGETGYMAFGLGSPVLFSPDGVNWSSFVSSVPDVAGAYLSDIEVFGGAIVASGSVFVDPGDGAFNYSLPAVWEYRGGLWAALGSSEWFDQPGYTYRIVTAPDRLVVIAETGTDDWALFTFVADQP